MGRQIPDRDLVFLQNPHEKPKWVGTKERKTFPVSWPVSCAHVLVCMPTDGPEPELYPLLSHMPGMVVLGCHSTACARAQKSEKKERGSAQAVAKAWHSTLGSWHIGFLLLFLAPGTPSSLAGRTQLQEVVTGSLPHPLADQRRDPVAGPDGRCSWWKEDLSKARGSLWEGGLGHLACSSSHSGFPHILSQQLVPRILDEDCRQVSLQK